MISSPIKRLNIAGKEILLIGTAHVSHQSAIEVDQLIRAEEFDCVAVELCPARLETMTDPERWKKTDIFTVIKEGKTMVLLSQLILSAYQKRIATKLGIEPGAEMRTAIKTASELNIPLSVIDRDIKVTLRRTWANMSFWAITKLLFSSVFSYSDANSISEEEIEKLKGEDELSSAIKEFSKELPQVKESLIDERDIYMAAKILEAEGRKIAAVIGAGHLEGIYRHLTSEHPLNYDELEIIPAPSPISKILAYGIPAFIVGMFLYGFIYFDMAKGFEAIKTWALATGIAAGIGAALAFAHPLSILSAILIAPIAAIHPGIATGWASGLVEAWIRSPKVSDFEALADDIQELSGFWRNRVMRILLVVCFSNLGCLVGMWFGSVELFKLYN